MDIRDGYTFQMFWEDLDNGFEIYYTYMECRYLIYKMGKNCYKTEIIDAKHKTMHQKTSMLTLKRVMELFEFMENLEYKSGF